MIKIVFTTQVFLFLFFPISIFMYIIIEKLESLKKIGEFIKKIRLKDLVIISFSIVFYMWSCFDDVFKFIAYIVLVYYIGKLVEKIRKRNFYINLYSSSDKDDSIKCKRIYIISFFLFIVVGFILFYLFYYKYSDVLYKLWNFFFSDNLSLKKLRAPLGISFITFSAISYIIDIYRKNATSGSFIDCMLYLSFFPKVVSGPIILWKDFNKQIRNRKTDLDSKIIGLNHIMIGFAKKVLLADVFGAYIVTIGNNVDQFTAILTILLYMLQIYYDFAGYSDIAIGISYLFGFKFDCNFNFPYRSASISEFWRRWHISLGTWFKEYVYFPLGGSRVEFKKILRNLFIVFLLTGIWHGAGLNYFLWGIINGLLVVIERIIRDKEFYKKIPTILKQIVTMFIVMLFWQFFRFNDITDMLEWFRIAIGNIKCDNIIYTWKYYINCRLLVFLVIAILGATVFGNPKIIEFYKRVSNNKIVFLLQELLFLILFALAIIFMVNSTYSPFIYFQY